MKRIISIALCLFVCAFSCLTLASCDPGNSSGSDYFSAEAIVSVEWVEYNNPEQKHFLSWVPDHTDDLKEYDISKETLKAVLDKNRHDEFFEQLSGCSILDTYFAYDSPNGNCIKVTYENGEFAIISCNDGGGFQGYIGQYYEDGRVKVFYGCFAARDSFEALLDDYFGAGIGSETSDSSENSLPEVSGITAE